MLLGKSTWEFNNKPVILSTGTVGGPMEAAGHIKDDFDILHDDIRLEKDSFEQAQQLILEQAADHAIKKANLTNDQINFFIGGDLINQITPTTLAAKTLAIPYLGIFSACATITESLALSAFIINNRGADYILSGTSSHRASAERQFRFPTEYGAQKPPTSQNTVTGAGCAVIGKSGEGAVITSATIGKIVDLGITDAFNMGAAMAPAAVDTIETHLKDLKIAHNYYDVILTGDLGEIGRKISLDLLHKKKIMLPESKYQDCGMTIYKDEQNVQSGASGPGCCAVVTLGHFIKKIETKQIKRLLVVATGALHSPLSINQDESIPCIAHAISIESGSDD